MTEKKRMTEYEETILLANKILDRINADPDDDLAMLSRQLLRTVEAYNALVERNTVQDGFLERKAQEHGIKLTVGNSPVQDVIEGLEHTVDSLRETLRGYKEL
jgi:hypothetical protein